MARCSPERAARQEQTARDVGAVFSEDGSRAEASRDTGAALSHVSSWCDPQGDKNMTLADARAVKHAGRRRKLGELVLGSEFVAVRRHASPSAAVDIHNATKLLDVSATTVKTALAALADAELSPSERRELIAQLDDMIIHAEGMRTALLSDVVPAPKSALRAVPK